MQETMIALSGHSLHGIEKTLEQGYFTAPGGFRVGVCLEPYAAKQGQALSLNIRIPFTTETEADPMLRAALLSGGRRRRLLSRLERVQGTDPGRAACQRKNHRPA